MKTFKDLKVGDKLYYVDSPRTEINSYSITDIIITVDYSFRVKEFITTWWVPSFSASDSKFGSLFSDINAVMKYINENI